MRRPKAVSKSAIRATWFRDAASRLLNQREIRGSSTSARTASPAQPRQVAEPPCDERFALGTRPALNAFLNHERLVDALVLLRPREFDREPPRRVCRARPGGVLREPLLEMPRTAGVLAAVGAAKDVHPCHGADRMDRLGHSLSGFETRPYGTLLNQRRSISLVEERRRRVSKPAPRASRSRAAPLRDTPQPATAPAD